MDWFLYAKDLRQERVKDKLLQGEYLISCYDD